MNEDKANMILGNIEQLTSLAFAFRFDEIETRLAELKQARDTALWEALNPQLADIRSGMATSETADNIEAIVKEIL